MRTPRGLRAAAGLLAPATLSATLLLASPAAAAGTATGEAASIPLGGARLATSGVVRASGSPSLPATTAAGWLVADLDSGEVLAAKDPHGKYAPASTLKTLTALTLIPKLDVRAQVRPTFDDVNVEGSKVGLVDTVSYPVGQLLTAMLVVSGNDAANALATANGGLAKTITEMNAEAERIQAFNTTAGTTSGLDAPGQVSTPYDLALIARAGMQLPSFRDYVATKRSQIRGPGGRTIAISSHDKLLYNYDGAIGIKNGFTTKARATFVGAATRGGRTLVVTLMKTNPRYWPEAAALLDWGFAASAAGAAPVGQLVDPAPLPEALPRTTGSTPAPIRQAAAAREATAQDGGLPLVPMAITGAGVVVLLSGFARTDLPRRRRRRLTLPPL